MKKFITSTVIVLTLLLLVTGCNKTKNLTDSEKFKEEYESLNKKDNGEVNYINVKINKENPIVYTTPKEVIDKINNKITILIPLSFFVILGLFKSIALVNITNSFLFLVSFLFIR